MNTLIYNRQGSTLDIGWESLAIRTGLLFSQRAYAIGCSPYRMEYDKVMLRNATTDLKLKIMLNDPCLSTDHAAFRDIQSDLSKLRKMKHRRKPEIVFQKQIEAIVSKAYSDYLKHTMTELRKSGLPQLAMFSKEERQRLILWGFGKDAGETMADNRLSSLFHYEWTETAFQEPDIFVIYEKLSPEVAKEVELTRLATVPNLNILGTEQLISVRDQLTALRNELSELLPLMDADEDGKRYLIGKWNLKGFRELVPRIQDRLDTMAELKWATGLAPTLRFHISVGSMDTAKFWHLFRRHNLFPEDTWAVLEQTMKEGNHCPYIPIMVIEPEDEGILRLELTTEESKLHRRKTLDLS